MYDIKPTLCQRFIAMANRCVLFVLEVKYSTLHLTEVVKAQNKFETKCPTKHSADVGIASRETNIGGSFLITDSEHKLCGRKWCYLRKQNLLRGNRS